MPPILTFDEHPAGLTWVLDEPMQRASHALVADGRVWLVDPTDVPEAMERVAALGEPAGVIQLLDRHERRCPKNAERLVVPSLRLPKAIPGSPFEVVSVLSVPRWREIALWWPELRALVVAEVVGTGPFYRGSDQPAGIHPFLRLHPPSSPRKYAPAHLLVGHGAPVHGPAAAEAVSVAYERSLRDIPGTFVRIAREVRG